MGSNRQQSQIITSRCNLLISAGAGTGKTHTLVEHLLSLLTDLNDPVDIDQVLVVTFTEAAAAELKERIRARLLFQIQHSKRDRPRLLRQLFRLDLARICTLHSFCYRLVQEHALELGLDPQFEILSHPDAIALRRLIFNQCLDRAIGGAERGWSKHEREALAELLLRYHEADDDRLFWVVNRLYDLSRSTADPSAWVKRVWRFWKDPSEEEIESRARPIVAQWWRNWRFFLEQLRSENPKASELLSVLGDKPPLSISGLIEICRSIEKSDKEWPQRRKGILRRPLECLFDEADQLLEHLTVSGPIQQGPNDVAALMQGLLRLLVDFSRQYQRQKQSDHVLEFADLEQYALDLLLGPNRDRPTDLAKGWAGRLRWIYVDEYQDINEAQDAIICSLAGVEPARRFDVTGDGPRRFLVGDVKQSIYAFRLTDPRIFSSYATRWSETEQNKALFRLTINYRSKASILSFVNHLFRELFQQSGQLDYRAADELCVGRADKEANEPAVEIWLVQGPSDRWLDTVDPLELEAQWIAKRIRELLDCGYLIYDPVHGAGRPVQPNDICILMRSPATMARPFLKHLDRFGVTAAISESDWSRLEVTDLLALLKLIYNPLCDEAALQVLRGPFVGLGVEELARLRASLPDGHLWEAAQKAVLEPDRALAQGFERWERLARFVEWYGHWRQASKSVLLSELLNTIIDQTGYLAYVERLATNSSARRAVERFLTEVQRLDGPFHVAIQRLLKNLELYQAEPVRAEEPLSKPGRVRVMSIHQSKGLEFPVVFVVGLGRRFNFESSRQRILTHVDWGVAPRLVDPHEGCSRHSLFSWLAQQQVLYDQLAEELRLLYVAMTRARDLLVLSGYTTTSGKGDCELEPRRPFHRAQSALEWLSDALGLREVLDGSCGLVELVEPKCRVWRVCGTVEIGRAEAGQQVQGVFSGRRGACQESLEVDEHARRLVEFQYPFEVFTSCPAKLSVSFVARDLAGAAEFETHAWSAANPLADVEVSGGVLVGSLVHRVLQCLPFRRWMDLDELREALGRLVAEGVIERGEAELIDLGDLYAFFSSQVAGLFQRPGVHIYRELPFTARFTIEEIDALGQAGGFGRLGGLGSLNCELQLASSEYIVIQGVADLVGLVPSKGFYVLDYKTDSICWEEVFRERLPIYLCQVGIYCRAFERVFRLPTLWAGLYFLRHRKEIKACGIEDI